MNKKDRENFKRVLLEQRAECIDHAQDHGGTRVSDASAGGVPDFADLAAKKAEIQVDDQLANSYDNLMEKIDLALERLEDGSYTTCAECGGEIPLERLKAKPAASLCIGCQEKKENQTGG